MITLNLIPPKRKQELLITQAYIIVKNLIILILLLAIIIAIILLVAKMTLQNNFNRVVEQTTLTTRYATTFGQEVKKFNTRLNAVAKIQDENTLWSEFLIKLSQVTPAEVVISTLSIKERRILINGLAKTRTKLLELKSNLENSELFSEVEIPLDNLLKKENIQFTIKANIIFDPL